MARTPVITAECTLSYPNLFTPRETPSGEEKFGCALIFDAAADLSELKAAARAAAEARWGDKAKAMLRDKSIRWPFRDGAEKSGRGYGPGTVFLNVSTTRAPGIVGRYARPTADPNRSQTRMSSIPDARSAPRSCRSPTTRQATAALVSS